MTERRICPACGDDFTDWPEGDNEGVWSRDGKRYCSGECVIYTWRMQHREQR